MLLQIVFLVVQKCDHTISYQAVSFLDPFEDFTKNHVSPNYRLYGRHANRWLAHKPLMRIVTERGFTTSSTNVYFSSPWIEGKEHIRTVRVNKKFTFNNRRTIVLRCDHLQFSFQIEWCENGNGTKQSQEQNGAKTVGLVIMHKNSTTRLTRGIR